METEATLAQLFCRSDMQAQRMIAGARNAVNDRRATAMDPIDLVIEAIKMNALPFSVQMELKSEDVDALLSVAMSHSGTFTKVPERMFYTEGMELLLRRLEQVQPKLKQGYSIEDWLSAAVRGRAPGEAAHYGDVYGASSALRRVMVNTVIPVAV